MYVWDFYIINIELTSLSYYKLQNLIVYLQYEKNNAIR